MNLFLTLIQIPEIEIISFIILTTTVISGSQYTLQRHFNSLQIAAI